MLINGNTQHLVPLYATACKMQRMHIAVIHCLAVIHPLALGLTPAPPPLGSFPPTPTLLFSSFASPPPPLGSLPHGYTLTPWLSASHPHLFALFLAPPPPSLGSMPPNPPLGALPHTRILTHWRSASQPNIKPHHLHLCFAPPPLCSLLRTPILLLSASHPHPLVLPCTPLHPQSLAICLAPPPLGSLL